MFNRFQALDVHDKRILFVASTGGHLRQASMIFDCCNPAPGSKIITFRNAQALGLAEKYPVEFIHYVKPRDFSAIARSVRPLANHIRTGDYDVVLSTGAGVALAALPIARAFRKRAIYVESFSRVDAPSFTGNAVAKLRGIECFTQHESWASDRWRYCGSVGEYVAEHRERDRSRGIKSPSAPRIFVTLGTISPYRFDALVDQVRKTLPNQATVTWQLGVTKRTGLPGDVHFFMTSAEFEQVADSADLIVSHGGVGTALDLALRGAPTVLVPRRAGRQEHVDDHQSQICQKFSRDGLAAYCEVEDLNVSQLIQDWYEA